MARLPLDLGGRHLYVKSPEGGPVDETVPGITEDDIRELAHDLDRAAQTPGPVAPDADAVRALIQELDETGQITRPQLP